MRVCYQNTKKVFSKKIYYLLFIIGFLIIAIPSYYFVNPELIKGNLGLNFLITEISLSILISFLFGLFFAISIYKVNYFSKGKSAIGVTGGFLAVLVSGCPACSITLASYLGLAGLISVLPYYGLELKILGLALLVYAVVSSLKTLEICKLKN